VYAVVPCERFANPDCRVFLVFPVTIREISCPQSGSASIQVIKNLEMSGSASYSTADNVINTFNENITEWTAVQP